MKRHFGFSDEQIEILENKKIGIQELFRFANDFDPTGNRAPVSAVTLYYYIDKKGDFLNGPKFKTKEICKQIFENLSTEEQVLVLKYANDLEDGVF